MNITSKTPQAFPRSHREHSEIPQSLRAFGMTVHHREQREAAGITYGANSLTVAPAASPPFAKHWRVIPTKAQRREESRTMNSGNQ